ncbi:hypothetical protein EVAR_92327_1 [Eumeta japonica]|uniref:Uncharacterized protein n=1 Tax=Eumeta variegata TaxID=151549 RepID=A0A4C1TJF5_EUMVA|nr:hypothetical protein EVAR_92327_1 [Eumeta japonica]
MVDEDWEGEAEKTLHERVRIRRREEDLLLFLLAPAEEIWRSRQGLRRAFELYRKRYFTHLLFAEPAHRGLSSCLLASYALGLICVRAYSQAVTATGFTYIKFI